MSLELVQPKDLVHFSSNLRLAFLGFLCTKFICFGFTDPSELSSELLNEYKSSQYSSSSGAPPRALAGQ